MTKRAALIAVVSVVFLDLIATCVAIGPIYPKVETSMSVGTPASIANKLRIESFASSPGVDLCSVWLQNNGVIEFDRHNYGLTSGLTSKTVSNKPPDSIYKDIDVVDGTADCNIVAMNVTSWYISGSTSQSYTPGNGTLGAIGVSNLESSGGFKVVFREDDEISPFIINFKDGIETRRLTGTKLLMASVLASNDHLYIGTIAGGTATTIGDFEALQPTSISISVYDSNTWAVCAITDTFGCVFSTGGASQFQAISVPITATFAAVSFVDCNNLAVVVGNSGQYFLDLLNLSSLTLSGGGYYSAGSNIYNAVSMATTDKITSILISNSTGVYLDVFSWTFPSACTTEPVPPIPMDTPSTIPTVAPLSNSPQTSSTTPSSPQNSPNKSPNNPGTTNPGTPPPSNVDGPKSDNNTPKGVDTTALGVGIAVPVAVLGVGAFLLVFLLRRRNKKKKQEKTIDNPVKDIDSPPPSIKPTEPGVYQNLPSNNAANNTYTSLSNVANDSYTTASAAIELPEIDKRLHIPYKSLVFIKEIGAGSYGKVFLGEWRGAKVAIKVNNQITDVDGFLAEAKLTLGIAPHPNLVQTFGVSLDGPNPCIVLEYCGGGSLDLVLYDNNKDLEVAKQREYAMKIAYGLLHLHNNNIVHRDLAARNILLTNDQQPKISDFGMSRVIQEENSKGHTKTNFGPIRWMAPESLRDRSYSVKSDVWSYGIVVNEIVSRKEPHVNEDQLSIAVRIRDQAATPEIPSDGDSVLVEVIHKCLKADSKDRPTMEELCQFLRAKLD